MVDTTDAIDLVPLAPRCAVHPELDAVASCASCANPICVACAADGGGALCLACRLQAQAVGFPYSRDQYALDGLFNLSLSRFKESWALLCAVAGAFWFLSYALPFGGSLLLRFIESRAASSGAAFSVASLLVGLLFNLMQLGGELLMLGVCLDVLEKKEPSLPAALGRLQRIPAAIAASLLAGVAFILVAGLLAGTASVVSRLVHHSADMGYFIVLGLLALLSSPAVIYLATMSSFVVVELVHEPETSVIAAYRKSWELVEGRFWPVLGIELVAALITLAGVFACCVGLVATLPLGMLLYCALFLALKNAKLGVRDLASSPEHPV